MDLLGPGWAEIDPAITCHGRDPHLEPRAREKARGQKRKLGLAQKKAFFCTFSMTRTYRYSLRARVYSRGKQLVPYQAPDTMYQGTF